MKRSTRTTIWSVAAIVALFVLLSWLAGCQTQRVQNCAPVPVGLFALPPSEARPAVPGMTEAEYLQGVIAPLVEDVEARNARLETIRAHQAPCR